MPRYMGGARGSLLAGLTNNIIPRVSGLSLVDSSLTDDGSTVTSTADLALGSNSLIFTSSTFVLDAANTLALRNGTNAQIQRVENTFTSATNRETLSIDWARAANVATITTDAGSGGGTVRALQLAGNVIYLSPSGAAAGFGAVSATGQWYLDGTRLGPASDGGSSLGASAGNRPNRLWLLAPAITAGSGTGVTVDSSGEVPRLVYKVTVTYAALAAAATTADKTIATLPAKVRLVSVLADTTTPYTGGGVTAATLIVGKTTGGNEYIVSHDVFSAAIFVGDLDADLGTSINRANAIQGGDLASWTGTTNVSVRLTTTTANTDQLTAGSTTYYLTTESMP